MNELKELVERVQNLAVNKDVVDLVGGRFRGGVWVFLVVGRPQPAERSGSRLSGEELEPMRVGIFLC